MEGRERGRAYALNAEKGKVGCSAFNLHAMSLVAGLSEERERQCIVVSHRGVTPQGKCLSSPLYIFIYVHLFMYRLICQNSSCPSALLYTLSHPKSCARNVYLTALQLQRTTSQIAQSFPFYAVHLTAPLKPPLFS